MSDNSLPEEKLLKLIRNKKARPQASAELPADKNSEPQVFPKRPSNRRLVRFRIVSANNLIFLLFLIACAFYTMSLISPFINGKEKKSLEPLQEEEVVSNAKTLEMKPVDFYLSEVQGRDFFHSAPAVAVERTTVAPPVDPLKDLKLIGVIAGDEPQAIVEDKKNQKTIYLRKGQFIGDLQVEDIQEGKIILKGQDGKLELYL
jgi:hypothetical protein